MVIIKSEDLLGPSRDNNLFEFLLAARFSKDLERAEELVRIPAYQRTLSQRDSFNYLKETYLLKNRCMSPLYEKVSLELRREYNVIHRRIANVLYDLA